MHTHTRKMDTLNYRIDIRKSNKFFRVIESQNITIDFKKKFHRMK